MTRRLALLAGCVVVLASCVSPVVIDEAVLSYDRALSRVRSEVLLLNVARARAGLPLNATEVTALTATFEFEAEAELGGGAAPIGGPGGPTGDLTLGLSTRALEAPTLSIVPLQGEAFTRRLLEPTRGETFEFLHHRGVAAVHAEAPSAPDTDWAQIVGLYDLLHRADPSPVVELNRAVALAMRDGPRAGLTRIDALLARGELADYHLAHSARADLCRRLGLTTEARASYERALTLARLEPERRFLARRLAELPPG
jgi:hypothetical protein